jgi:hypothetical protein
MTAAQSRPLFVLGWALLLNMLGSGCTVGAKSFSMDSTSRMPFFGLELKERKPKSTAPTFNSISRSNADVSRVESPLRALPLNTNGLVKTSGGQLVAVTEYDAPRPTTGSFADTPDAVKPQPVQSIPFPMIGGRQSPTGRPESGEIIDFQ